MNNDFMNKYNFDEIIPRKGTHSYKWDYNKTENLLPMWVADMDFRAAPAIVEALANRVQHGVYGYTKVPTEYFEAVTSWFKRRHQFHIENDWIVVAAGVVPAISAVIKSLTVAGDQVMIQTPVYNRFPSCIRNAKCEVVENVLIYKNGLYSIDFEDFEKKASNPLCKAFVLCNPHNPVGRVWSKEELTRMGEICIKHGVTVISDEIHCDLINPGFKHIAFGSISKTFLENSVTTVSPSKSFNLAGLQVANIIAAKDDLRQKIDIAMKVSELYELNPFAVEGLMAAYNKSEQWLDALNEYLFENYKYLKNFFEKELPQFKVLPLEGTYLVWVDITSSGLSSAEVAKLLLEKQNLWISHGTLYGDSGEGFIRINIGCPKELVIQGLKKIKAALNSK